jgi:hypothetical protein
LDDAFDRLAASRFLEDRALEFEREKPFVEVLPEFDTAVSKPDAVFDSMFATLTSSELQCLESIVCRVSSSLSLFCKKRAYNQLQEKQLMSVLFFVPERRSGTFS